jgi:hypothetical protein
MRGDRFITTESVGRRASYPNEVRDLPPLLDDEYDGTFAGLVA